MTLAEKIEALKSLPAKSLRTGSMSRDSHSLGDLLDLLDEVGNDEAVKAKKSPVLMRKIRTGGPVL